MLAIDGGGFDTASEAFVGGNQTAAEQYAVLTRALAGYGAMAGTDSSSSEFAASYDAAAGEAVRALADLVAAYASLGRITDAALTNHRVANARSVIGGAQVYEGGPMRSAGCVTVLPATPPTALGGDLPALPSKVGWILDHVQGAVYPDADTDQLRAAAGTWRGAAAALDQLVVCCDYAVRGLWDERSPEVPLAVAATHDLRATVRGVAEQYAALAAACDSYADHVEETRAQVLHLAEWLLEQVVEGVVISAAIGLITGGAGAAAGMSAVIARVAAESPRFAALIDSLRALAAGVSDTVRGTRDLLAASRVRLVKFTAARLALRDERGELSILGREPGWLGRHEGAGGHTLARHVGRTDEQLLERLERSPHLKRVSTFIDLRTAEAALRKMLTDHQSAIVHWLKHGERSLELDSTFTSVIGRVATRDGTIVDEHSVRLVLVRDRRMPNGFHILTAYPNP